MANPFVHVELHTKDLPRAREFYSRLFGWKLQDMPMPGGGSYTMIDVGGGADGWMSVITDPTGATLAMWKAKNSH
jgi:predicted enzyme related to lactoylglutathione lyase